MRVQVTPLLQECFDHILKEGTVPPSWREAIISINPKKVKIGRNAVDTGQSLF